MKKLLISALAVVAALVAVDMSANSCCRTKKRCAPRCETVCEQPKRGRICETVYNESPMPNVRCVKYVPQESCCNVRKIVNVEYEAACPPGYSQDGEQEYVTNGRSLTTKHADKAAGKTWAGKKYAEAA